MSRKFICLVFGFLLIAVPTASALATDEEDCTRLSFSPLDRNIPACTRLIETNGLGEGRLLAALLARAEAYGFALTYHWGRKIDEQELLEKAVADLNRAVTIARNGKSKFSAELRQALERRASLSLQLGRPEQAIRDYTSALQMPEGRSELNLHGRAMAAAAMGRHQEALADLTEVIRATKGTLSHRNWIFARGLMNEAAGKPQAAIEDFRLTLEIDPGHHSAKAALERLDADTSSEGRKQPGAQPR
jgi:tetratricopeptide (TPR) repeat protein